LLTLLVCTGLYGLYAAIQRSDGVLPGIWVRDIPLSGLTLEQSAQALHERWNEGRTLRLVDGLDPSRTWEKPAGALGLGVDTQATAQRAFSLGRSSNPLVSLVQAGYLYWFGTTMEPIPSFEEVTARRALSNWASAFEIASVDGTVRIEGAQVVAANGLSGKALDIDLSLDFLAEDPLAVLDYGIVPLAMVPTEPTIGEVSHWAAQADALIHSDLRVEAYDPVRDDRLLWDPSPERIASWVSIQRTASAFSLNLDEEAMAQDLEAWLEGMDGERTLSFQEAFAAAKQALQSGEGETLVVRYEPRTVQVNPNESLLSIAAQAGMPYWKLLEYNPGLQGRGPVGTRQVVLPPRDAMLSLPVVVDKRIEISISEQRMWVYQNGELVREAVISTGIGSSPTLPGVFQIKSHYLNAYASNWDLWMPHFMGIYDAVPGFENGIHGLPILSNGARLWADVLGQPASYGCIILDLENAEWLYQWAEEGVVVEILR
jgi:hypothetical protein